jgi:Zn-finger nucleic acid-binding protein
MTVSAETVACPHCGKSVNQRIRNCPFCGGEIVRQVARREPVCPRCGCGVENFDYREARIGKCPRCAGLWLANQDFELLTSERDVYRDDAAPTRFVREPPPLEAGLLACPCCDQRMNRFNFKSISGVMIDWCRDCGWWLDAGELEQVRAFIAAGGLEKAQDREIARNREGIEVLASRVGDLEFMQKVIHRWNPKRWLFDGF